VPDLLPVGANQYAGGDYNNKNVITSKGTSAAYAIARLRRDRCRIAKLKHPPKGIGVSVDLVRRLLADNKKASALFERALSGESAQEIDANVPDLLPTKW
jgi:hypothetical protein